MYDAGPEDPGHAGGGIPSVALPCRRPRDGRRTKLSDEPTLTGMGMVFGMMAITAGLLAALEQRGALSRENVAEIGAYATMHVQGLPLSPEHRESARLLVQQCMQFAAEASRARKALS